MNKKIMSTMAVGLFASVSVGVWVNSVNAEAEGVKAEKKTAVDATLPEYKTVAGISGNISSVGSDTLNNLMTAWGEDFRKHYPNAKVTVEGKGSSTAPPALIDGTADLGPMSREMKEKEINAFEKKFGYKPAYTAVAIDALAVFVHKDNPVEGLSLQEVDAIFSKTRKGNHSEDITKWGQVGLDGDWENLSVTLFGRNAASGTYGYFKKKALFKGDFKASVKEQAGSSAVVQGISEDRSAIGYSGIGYKTAGVRAVPLSKKAGETAYEATADNCYNGKYPLSRFLYIYFNREPGKAVPAKVREFFKLAHSKSGQEIVLKNGFVPMPKKLTDKFAKSYDK